MEGRFHVRHNTLADGRDTFCHGLNVERAAGAVKVDCCWRPESSGQRWSVGPVAGWNPALRRKRFSEPPATDETCDPGGIAVVAWSGLQARAWKRRRLEFCYAQSEDSARQRRYPRRCCYACSFYQVLVRVWIRSFSPAASCSRPSPLLKYVRNRRCRKSNGMSSEFCAMSITLLPIECAMPVS